MKLIEPNTTEAAANNNTRPHYGWDDTESQLYVNYHRSPLDLGNLHIVLSPEGSPASWLRRSFGQLGCQGFIIFDGSGKLIRKRTPPFLKVRHLAFAHVDVVLSNVVKSSKIPSVCPGEIFRLRGLQKRPELNGTVVVCVASAPEAGGRCNVIIASTGKNLSVKEENLQVADAREYERGVAVGEDQRGCEPGDDT